MNCTAKQLKMFDTVGNYRFGEKWKEIRIKIKEICKVKSARDISKRNMNIILDRLANGNN